MRQFSENPGSGSQARHRPFLPLSILPSAPGSWHWREREASPSSRVDVRAAATAAARPSAASSPRLLRGGRRCCGG